MSSMGWPFDPTVYIGLAVLYLGHAWLARGEPDIELKHSLYVGLGLITVCDGDPTASLIGPDAASQRSPTRSRAAAPSRAWTPPRTAL